MWQSQNHPLYNCVITRFHVMKVLHDSHKWNADGMLNQQIKRQNIGVKMEANALQIDGSAQCCGNSTVLANVLKLSKSCAKSSKW